MRIAIFTNNYLPNPYGVAGSVESFRKVFEKLGHDVFIFAPRWKGYQDENPNVFRYPSIETNVKIKFSFAIPFSLKISKVLEKLDLDIIHSQHPNLMGSAAMHWAKKKNIPLVFTWHTLYDQYAHFAPFIPKRIAA
jgi:1,2-diacylglycerol 3-alpha-glucosyltransferase